MNIFSTTGTTCKILFILLLAGLFALPVARSQAGYFIHFPNDLLIQSCDYVGYDVSGLPGPDVSDPSGTANIGINNEIEYFTNVPGYCFVIERTWTVIDWNTYDTGLPCIVVPNPNPNANPGHPANLVGPVVSAPGTGAPWTPTIVKITPSDPGPTDFSAFWDANANCYQYKQYIRFNNTAGCPGDTVLSVAPFLCTAALTYNVTVTADEPGWTLTQTAGLPSGAAFPLGATVNQFTVTEVNGATSTCSFTVTVNDFVPPVAACDATTIVNVPNIDDPGDCYDGGVVRVVAAVFDDGSYDNCSNNLLLTARRTSPLSDCINALNAINGHPNCDDQFPDFPSEFERAVMEDDTIKFYCCEAGTIQDIILRVYQLNSDQSLSTGPDGAPIYTECVVSVQVKMGNYSCEDTTMAVTGQITLDADGDCLPDAPAAAIPGMIVKLTDNAGEAHYASSDANGYYRIEEPAEGPASLAIVGALELWNICNNPVALTIPAGAADVYQDFQAQPLSECPMLNLRVATNLIRPCSTSVWAASYCNLGGAAAEDAFVTLVAGDHLTLTGASKPYVLNGDTMIVQLGDVAVGECDAFAVFTQAACDPMAIGARACLEARIFPDTFCIPASGEWSGAQIVASGVCDGDSVRFTLRNSGIAPTMETLDYVIIDDMVIMREGQLPAGMPAGSTVEEVVYASGDAIRVDAEQESGHPAAQAPSVGVEGCNGTTPTSLLLDFRNEDGDPFSDFECREIVGSYDPNEKLAFPRGFSDQHFIEPNTPLTYQVNFQNTGNDTAFLVVLRDTLSALLDPATLRVGAGSHPFDWTLEGPGILTFIFTNILLPDSTTNEPVSHGFVQFDIAQKTDNPIGSVIENRAGIYFDINPVVLTNTVWHTVGIDFLDNAVAAYEPFEAATLRVFPNPAQDRCYLPLEGGTPVQVTVTDLFGRPLRQFSGQAPGLWLQRDGLPEGAYLVHARFADGRVQAGKVVWK